MLFHEKVNPGAWPQPYPIAVDTTMDRMQRAHGPGR